MKNPAATQAWQQLNSEYKSLTSHQTTIHDLFEKDGDRLNKYSISTAEFVFDFSKNLLTDEVFARLIDLAEQCQLPTAIKAIFGGEIVNTTEHRAALHTVLRGHHVADLEESVNQTLARMEKFVTALREGSWTGYSGQRICDVVNIGIGGSQLGPAMAVKALEKFADQGLHTHFISNVDPAAATEVLVSLNPESTLFVIASKSFTTLETHQNASYARRWFLSNGGSEELLGKHFVAVSSNVKAAEQFGIEADNIFPMWDWVGGRYSMWSAIGLPIALSVGMDHFKAMLKGAQACDHHFQNSPLPENIPVVMALLNIWYRGFFGTASQAILPYSQRLQLFPAFLQQLSMESLGKSVNLAGQAVTVHTGAVIWGAAGTDGQHSFHQLLHQGTDLIPADFIAIARSDSPENDIQHAHLLANCFSQSQALMDGKTEKQALEELLSTGMDEAKAKNLAPHKTIPGNRPSNTLLMPELKPFNLGYLTALYEHCVYVQSVIWNINAFDQWGVELGKALSTDVFEALTSNKAEHNFDASTSRLIELCKSWEAQSSDS